MFRLLGKTHPGAVREQNEDAFYSNDSTGLAAVVDGMGGYAAGEVASAIIVESLGELNPASGGLVAALMECHARILQHSKAHPESKGMGAAVVVAKLEPKQLSVCWAGDSRAYLFNRETGLRRVSRDHSYVHWLFSQGKITEDEARNHPKRNLVTQCLGLSAPQPELTTVAWKAGDSLLLCSDGLTDELDDRSIENTLNQALSADDFSAVAVDELIAEALEAGGKDNVTVLIAENRYVADDMLDKPKVVTTAAAQRHSLLPILLGAGAAVLVLTIGLLWHFSG
ncbi:protein phosphatase 2C domain-containing protein [Marinobacter sp. S6332]|uniref:PP2C family protein-serine/threonine phosphatase n=1 Tax=Marinobacter sp. S6332 TaxID=2926403 RepID=UPI001FF46BA4|nr:protein phosphatase 2C domain-containing protein [Marinobacter sp. S6332]MCK0165686.1 protein phosphatase 2C domain-containing protein [Marinobacter sp. S6332]